MTAAESARLLRRMDSAWPSRGKLDDDVYAEWVEFLAEYGIDASLRAFYRLRESCTWRPSMAEFRAAFHEAVAVGDVSRPQLAAGTESDAEYATLHDRFGSNQDHWVYCWRCDMAVSLNDLEHNMGWDAARGLFHFTCPRRGFAPQIPAAAKMDRDKWFLERKVGIGPDVKPVPHRGW